MAGKVIWHVTMSLDGFIAAPDESMDWAFGRATEPLPEADAVIKSTGAVLAGRRWWDSVAKTDGLGGIYGGAWTGPVVVLTHRKAKPDSPRLTFISKSIREAVSSALEAAGGKDVVIFGADVAQQCIRAHLLNEMLIHVVPVLLGGGVRLIADDSVRKTDLETISVTRSGQITNMRLRVRG
jgi:dihydrofolate reductase